MKQTQPMSDMKYYTILGGLVIFMFAVLYVIFLVGVFIYDSTPICAEEQRTVNTSIATLSDGALASGSFFVGIGSFSDKMYYIYYEGESEFRLKKVDVDYASIVMDENDQPHLTTYFNVSVCKDRKTNEIRDAYHIWLSKRYVFHVPEGTIVRKYNLDGVV